MINGPIIIEKIKNVLISYCEHAQNKKSYTFAAQTIVLDTKISDLPCFTQYHGITRHSAFFIPKVCGFSFTIYVFLQSDNKIRLLSITLYIPGNFIEYITPS